MASSVAANTAPETPRESEPAFIALPTTPTSIASSSHLPSAAESELPKFLKPPNFEHVGRSPTLPHLTSIASAGLRTSPAPQSSKLGPPPRYPPQPLTGVAAMADERRLRDESERLHVRQQSPNPAKAALGALIGGGADKGISRLQDDPSATNTMSEPMMAVARSIKIPKVTPAENAAQTSPVSMSSFGTIESTTVPTALADSSTMASPRSMGEAFGAEGGPIRDKDSPGNAATAEDAHTTKALTFPGPLISAQLANDARRGMSLPHAGLGQSSPRSLAAKKHKCPYCSTDFTRHHNLKSHLLTHSHEKPYVCQTCQARFRRLHDLKRHTKLHTGEKPHICPKCGRRFARGDALARHNKGQGGCAGRRASLGSYGGDDDFGEGSQGGHGGEDSMDGLMYTGDASHDPDNMDEDTELADERRRLSLPSIKKHDVPTEPQPNQASASQSVYHPRQPSTYPPVAARQPTGGLYPPNVTHGGGQSSVSTSPATPNNTFDRMPAGGSGSSAFQIGGQSIFSQGGMTESPKPLSPACASSRQLGHSESNLHRNRSPSLKQPFQQHHYGRRASARTPPPLGLPPPISGGNQSNPPQLPSLPGLTPPDPRFTLHSQGSASSQLQQSGLQAGQPGTHQAGGGGTPSAFHPQSSTGVGGTSSSDSHSGRGQSAHGPTAGDPSNNMFATGTDGLWAYVRGLEERMNRLQDEVISLKSQLAAAQNR
ncbi:hypothetical protein MMC16_005659 [Acarospora aff. strigata]|nr:hypothetical protein [Acarospora aff. strigata]